MPRFQCFWWFLCKQISLRSCTSASSQAIGKSTNTGAQLHLPYKLAPITFTATEPPVNVRTQAFNKNSRSWSQLASFLHYTAKRSINPVHLYRCLIISIQRQTAWEQRQLRRQPSGVYCPCLMREKKKGGGLRGKEKGRERENEHQASRLYSPPGFKKWCFTYKAGGQRY